MNPQEIVAIVMIVLTSIAFIWIWLPRLRNRPARQHPHRRTGHEQEPFDHQRHDDRWTDVKSPTHDSPGPLQLPGPLPPTWPEYLIDVGVRRRESS